MLSWMVATRISEVESTIIDLTASIPTMLRPGGVSLEELRMHLSSIAFRPQHVLDDEIAPSPGTLMKHYSPDAEILVYSGEDDKVWNAMREKAQALLGAGCKVGIMALDEDVLRFEGIMTQYVMLGKDMEAMAANLFSGMRELDTTEMDIIMVRAPEASGLGLAIYDRLHRATGGHIIKVE